jgi:hypothetical protein
MTNTNNKLCKDVACNVSTNKFTDRHERRGPFPDGNRKWWCGMENKKKKITKIEIYSVALGMVTFNIAYFFKDNISTFIKLLLLIVPMICFVLHLLYLHRFKKHLKDELNYQVIVEASIYSKAINFYILMFLTIFSTLFKIEIPLNYFLFFYCVVFWLVIKFSEMLVESKYL